MNLPGVRSMPMKRVAGLRQGGGCVLSVLLVLCLAAGPAGAARVSGLYEAEVPVLGQDAEQRNEAIREAFRRVLVKLTGNRAIAGQAALAGDIPQASRYVEQYRYRLAPAGSAAVPAELAQAPVPGLLKVQFDSSALNRLLRERGLPLWGDVRPAVLLWLAVDQGGRRGFLTPELDEQAYQAMTVAAGERGVPLLLPLMDLEDQTRLQVADVWGGFAERIRAASDRYGPDALISGRLVEVSPQQWHASWTLVIGGETAVWDSEGASREMAAAQGVQEAIDRLAARFAPLAAGGSAGRIHLRVAGVESLRDYVRVSRYLSSQGTVEQADLLSVEPDAVIFELSVRGSEQVLEQALALGGVLRPQAREAAAGGALDPSGGVPLIMPLEEAFTLYYRLQP